MFMDKKTRYTPVDVTVAFSYAVLNNIQQLNGLLLINLKTRENFK